MNSAMFSSKMSTNSRLTKASTNKKTSVGSSMTSTPGARSTIGNMEPIRVALRIAPNVDKNKKNNSCVSMSERDDMKVWFDNGAQKCLFEYDYVLDDSNSTSAASEKNQRMAYLACGKPVVDAALSGRNGCCFSYGQHGSGKTHTMIGKINKAEAGVIPRAIDDLFHAMKTDKKHAGMRVKVAMFEMYNEQVFDLAQVEKPKLEVKCHPVYGVYIPRLTETVATTPEQCKALLHFGNANKYGKAKGVKANNISRGHTILLLKLEQPACSANPEGMASSLWFADLAGYETENADKLDKQHALETGYINKSLFHLSECLNMLGESHRQTKGFTENQSTTRSLRIDPESSIIRAEDRMAGQLDARTARFGNRGGFVGFRNSKLTMVLEEGLVGDACTTCIACVKPLMRERAETNVTLKFAEATRNVFRAPGSKRVFDRKEALEQLDAEISAIEKRLREEKEGKKTSPRQTGDVIDMYIANTNEIECVKEKTARRISILEEELEDRKYLKEQITTVETTSSSSESKKGKKPSDFLQTSIQRANHIWKHFYGCKDVHFYPYEDTDVEVVVLMSTETRQFLNNDVFDDESRRLRKTASKISWIWTPEEFVTRQLMFAGELGKHPEMHKFPVPYHTLNIPFECLKLNDKSDNSAMSSELSAVQSRYEAAAKQVRDREAELLRVQSELNMHREEVQVYRMRVERTNETLVKTEGLRKADKEALEKIEGELRSTQQTLKSFEQHMGARNDDATELEKALLDVESQLKDQSEAMDQLNFELDHQEQQASARVNTMSSELLKMKTEIKIKTSTIAKLQETEKSLKGEMALVQQELDSVTQEWEQVKAAFSEYKAQVQRELELMATANERDVQALKAAHKKELRDMEMSIESREARYMKETQRLELQLRDMQTERNEVSAALYRSRDETEGIRQKAERLEAEIKALKKQLADVKTAFAVQEGTLKADIEQKSSTIDRLMKEIRDLKTAKSALEADANRVRNESSSAQSEIARLQKKFEASARDNGDLRKNVLFLHDEAKGFKMTINRLTKTNEEQSAELARKMAELQKQVDQLAALDVLTQEQNEELENKKAELTRLKEELARKNVEMEQLEGEVSTLQATERRQRGTISALEQKTRHTEADLAESRKTVASMADTISHKDERYAELLEESEQKAIEIANMKKMLLENEREIASLTRQLKDSEDKYSEKTVMLQRSLREANDNYDVLQKQYNELQERMLTEITERDNDVMRVKRELTSERQRAANAEADVKDLTEENKRRQEAIDEMQGKLIEEAMERQNMKKEYVELLERVEGQLRESRKEVAELKSAMHTLKMEFSAERTLLEDHIAQKEVENLELIRIDEQLGNELSDAKDEIATLKRQLADAKRECSAAADRHEIESAELKAKIAAVQKALAETQLELEVTVGKLGQLSEEKKALLEELTQKDAELAKKETEIASLQTSVRSLQGDLDYKQSQLVIIRNEMAELKQNQEKNLHVKTLEIERLKKEVYVTKDQLKRANELNSDEVQKCKSKITELIALTEELRAANRFEKEEYNRLLKESEEKLQMTLREVEELRAQVATLRKEKAALEQQLESANAENASLRKQKANALEIIAKKEQQVEDMMAEFKKFSEEEARAKAQLRQDNAALKKDIETLETTEQTLYAELVEQKERLAELRRLVQEHKEADSERAQKMLTAMQEKEAEFKKVLARKEDRIAFLEDELTREQADNTDKLNRIAALENDLANKNATIERQDGALTDLRVVIQKKTEELNIMIEESQRLELELRGHADKEGSIVKRMKDRLVHMEETIKHLQEQINVETANHQVEIDRLIETYSTMAANKQTVVEIERREVVDNTTFVEVERRDNENKELRDKLAFKDQQLASALQEIKSLKTHDASVSDELSYLKARDAKIAEELRKAPVSSTVYDHTTTFSASHRMRG